MGISCKPSAERTQSPSRPTPAPSQIIHSGLLTGCLLGLCGLYNPPVEVPAQQRVQLHVALVVVLLQLALDGGVHAPPAALTLQAGEGGRGLVGWDGVSTSAGRQAAMYVYSPTFKPLLSLSEASRDSLIAHPAPAPFKGSPSTATMACKPLQASLVPRPTHLHARWQLLKGVQCRVGSDEGKNLVDHLLRPGDELVEVDEHQAAWEGWGGVGCVRAVACKGVCVGSNTVNSKSFLEGDSSTCVLSHCHRQGQVGSASWGAVCVYCRFL